MSRRGFQAETDPQKLAQMHEQAEEFWRIRAQQPGYRGAVTIGTGHGTVLIVTLWETQEQAAAAGATLEPEARRLMGEIWTTSPRVVAGGLVVYDDIPRV